MSAGLLTLAGFTQVEPQQPLGGPDGGRDIVCRRDGRKFVAACYFPGKSVTFSAVSKKFNLDLTAALKHTPQGFVFLTNQSLTAKQRDKFRQKARESSLECDVMDREACRNYLDEPRGYGLRLEHLGIEMSKEEQLAFWAASSSAFLSTVDTNTRSLDALAQRLESYVDARVRSLDDIKFGIAHGMTVLRLIMHQMQKCNHSDSDNFPLISRFARSCKSWADYHLPRYRKYLESDASMSEPLKKYLMTGVDAHLRHLEASLPLLDDGRKDPAAEIFDSVMRDLSSRLSPGAPIGELKDLPADLKRRLETTAFQLPEHIKRMNLVMQCVSKIDEFVDKAMSEESVPEGK
jgi:hypothetical protein